MAKMSWSLDSCPTVPHSAPTALCNLLEVSTCSWPLFPHMTKDKMRSAGVSVSSLLWDFPCSRLVHSGPWSPVLPLSLEHLNKIVSFSEKVASALAFCPGWTGTPEDSIGKESTARYSPRAWLSWFLIFQNSGFQPVGCNPLGVK